MLSLPMENNQWKATFGEVFNRAVAAWKSGRRSAQAMFVEEEKNFLATIGCSTQELFDFVEDHLQYGDPDYSCIEKVTELRQGYFQTVMKGNFSGHVASMKSLPPKTAAIEGIEWLPRIIEKARLKLRGEMPPELMYGCAGDRMFVQSVHMTLPQFLKLVWDAGNDTQHIVDSVKKALTVITEVDPPSPLRLK
jgi:hypothetical protein